MPNPREMTAEELARAHRVAQNEWDPGVLTECLSLALGHIAALAARAESRMQDIEALKGRVEFHANRAEKMQQKADRARDAALEEAALEAIARCLKPATGHTLAGCIRALKSRPAERMVPESKVREVLAELQALTGWEPIAAAMEVLGMGPTP